MLSNLPFKVVPIALTVAMLTTEMPAAIRPYSIAGLQTRLSKTQ